MATRRAERRRKWGMVYRALLALLILSAGIIKVLIDAKLWTTAPQRLLPALLVAILLASFRDSLVSAIFKYRTPARQARRENVQKAVVAALAQIASHRQVPMLDLGASVFTVYPGPRWVPDKLRERWGWSRPRLERVLRFRADETPQASDVVWFKGKGTIGECWQFDKVRHKYWLPVAEAYEGKDLSAAGFAKVPNKTTMNMTQQEFASIVGKYAEILAVPIKGSDGRLVGVLSVDIARRGRTRSQGELLNGDDVERLVTTAASVIHRNI